MELFSNLKTFFLNFREGEETCKIWENMIKEINGERVEDVTITLWTIWNLRNRVLISNDRANFQLLYRQIKKNLHEQRKRINPNLAANNSEKQWNHGSWSPPPSSFLKMNVDASWNENFARGGIGWVVCDSLGYPIGIGYKFWSRR